MCAAFLALAAWACAFTANAQPQPDLRALKAFEGCWTGVFAGQNHLRDDRCFTQVNLGAQWNDVHTVAGAGYGGVSMYAWDPELRRIDVTYYASDGALMRGYAIAEVDGLSFPDARYIGADGRVLHLRSRWRFTASDRFEAVTEREEDGVWTEFMRIVYARPSADDAHK
ncbi:hypothetical protein [Terricaulis sp.]|uniref:hypothetical protein n=1 Tax=Terricaulis sp. TaxID=2768686 RepID=UPI0037852037